MRYMLLIYVDENIWLPGEREACMEKSRELCHELSAEGTFVAAAPLHPVATATSIRVREGRTLITDGPFAETHEQLGGYYIVDVPDLDAAMAIAQRLPPVTRGSVEIRPVVELPDMP